VIIKNGQMLQKELALNLNKDGGFNEMSFFVPPAER
jgi:hypothetical protein